MIPTWGPGTKPAPLRFGLVRLLLALMRAIFLGSVVFGGLAVLLFFRSVERPIFGLRRPVTPYITQGVCRVAFGILGIAFKTSGAAMQHPGAAVANHVSWLDIFALNASKRIYFVSKSEVAGWPAIGWLARATGTVFIRRSPKHAKHQKAVFEARLLAGHRLLFFPEGTSTDGLRILPFKSTLFAAFFSESLRRDMYIQPVTVLYHAPPGQVADFYGWWGDSPFGRHLLKTLL
ncbi:MAG: 1-acyl-sn-glycerol-3-phosphate acyltransferase, partial [Paracoccaceae bacterium]|nr:1-acyl-sn-glycerol-3-phosphate acyltransferase [Paracoccaceae bacterium]